jgi:hypothetical protein
MPSGRLFYRGLCVLCGLLGIGIFVRSAMLGGWYVYLGIVCLLVGLIVTSLVTRKW